MASVGSTPDEAKAMLLKAATLHIEGANEDGLPYLRPVPTQDDPRQIAPDTIAEIFRFKL